MATYFIILIILSGAVIVLAFFVIRLHTRLQKFLKGKSGADLEDSILEMDHALKGLTEKSESQSRTLHDLSARTKKSIRGIEVKRFNPFADAGSNQSFSVAFLDDEGDGVVLSSIYARERMSVYAKPILKGVSSYELTGEEDEVLSRASKH